jgi:pyrroline-5-carboxylate reductase
MTHKLSRQKLALLGGGKLGGILLRGLLQQGLFATKDVVVTVRHAERAAALGKEVGVEVTTQRAGELLFEK